MSEYNFIQILDLAGFYITAEQFCVFLYRERFGAIEFDIGSGLTELKVCALPSAILVSSCG